MERATPAATPPVPVAAIGRGFQGTIKLSQAPDGARVRVHATELECDDCDLLNALGLTDRCEVRVCKVGNPCIVQVRSTRIGLSMRLADRILVISDERDSA